MSALLKNQEKITLLKELYERALAEESFYEFVKQAWPQIEGDNPFIDGWHIKAVCDHLEAAFRGEIKRLLINVPPRTCKTTVVSIMLPAWIWIHRPQTKFVYAAHAKPISLIASRLCRMLVDSPWYKIRWGHIVQLSKDQASKGHFENTEGGYRISTSVNAATTGLGGDVLVLDDPNDAKDGDSEATRDSANDWVDRVWSSRHNPGGLGISILNQQRVHEKDVSGHMIAKDESNEIIKLILPMEFEPSRRAATIILPSTNGKLWMDPRSKPGELLWPQWMTREKVEKIKKSLGSDDGGIGQYIYATQYQQRPAPIEGGIIKAHWFSKWEQDRPPKMLRVIQSLDTAFEIKDKNSFSAILTFGLFKPEKKESYELILLNLWRGKLEYPDLRDLCKKLYKDYRDDGVADIEPDNHHKVDMMLVEAKANGASLVQDLRRGGINAHKFDPNKYGDKNQRISLASSLIKEGLVNVPMFPPDFKKYRKISQNLIDMCKTFPNVESRDVVDCLSQVILYLMSSGILAHPFDKDVFDSLGGEREAFKSPYGVDSA
jgi:predicted phage terminase large subunit-like protein